MANFNLNVNKEKQQADFYLVTYMEWVQREHRNMPGTKYGFRIAVCGACTIQPDHAATRSCQLPITSVGGKAVSTIPKNGLS